MLSFADISEIGVYYAYQVFKWFCVTGLIMIYIILYNDTAVRLYFDNAKKLTLGKIFGDIWKGL